MSETASPAAFYKKDLANKMYQRHRRHNKKSSHSSKDFDSIMSREVLPNGQKGVGARSLIQWKANEGEYPVGKAEGSENDEEDLDSDSGEHLTAMS